MVDNVSGQYGDDPATSDASSYVKNVAQPSKLGDDALYSYVKDNFLKDAAHSEEWREQAKKDDDFVSGDQWEQDMYKRMVKDEKKQPITFNQTHKLIQLVAGQQINGRRQVVYLPRGLDEGEIVMNEDLNQASKWMADGCKAHDHESAAFKQMLKTGMGWLEMRLDYEVDAQGKYIEEHIDERDCYWDRSARKKNLSDAHRVYRVKKMKLVDARALAESLGAEALDEELDAAWAIGVDQKAVKPREDIRLKQGPGNAIQEGVFESDPNQEVHVVQVQWWEREVYHRVKHPQTGQEVIMPDHEHRQLIGAAKKQNIRIVSARQTRKVYMQAFVAGKVLARMPCPCPDRFTLQCMTGELWKSKGWWFGLVRLLRDPQMWSNKLYSQAIHILNHTAKGGIVAEADAFKDIREAQRNWNKPEGIVLVEPGAISKGKIMQKPGTGLATPFVEMMTIADKMFYSTSGINPELLAMNDTNIPGILDAQRKQTGMTILAPIFDSFSSCLYEVGNIRLYFIQEHLADGRLIRIIGKKPGAFQAVRLMKDKVAGVYDVEVADAPNSPDIKTQAWNAWGMMAPMLRDHPNAQGLLPIMLQDSPFPSERITQITQALQAPNPMQQAKTQIMAQDAMAKIEDRKAQAQQRNASALRDKASVISAFSQALLNVANAQHVDAQLREQQIANMLNGLMMSVGNVPDFSDQPFAVTPTGEGGPQSLGQLPQLPTMGGGGAPNQTPGQLNPATVESVLAQAAARQAAGAPRMQ